MASPWSGLPPELADQLRPTLPALVAEIIDEISAQVPAYADARDSDVGATLTRGVDLAMERMLTLFGTVQGALDDRARRFYARIGAGEYAAGRTLDSVLSAYRTGARLAWDRLARAALAADVGADRLVVLAESIFVYIDELSAATAQGHAAAAEVDRGYREVVRSQLAQALVDGRLAREPADVVRLADSAEWPLPETVAVAVVPKSGAGPGPVLPHVPPAVLVWERERDAVAVLPDPERRRAELARGVSGPVFVGTVRPTAEAPVSFGHATALRDLAARGLVPDHEIVLSGDHLAALLLAADPALAATISEHALRPIAHLPDGKREALAQTVRAWLELAGDRSAVARRLVVHPQTVSYRMNQARELFGERLDDPRERLLLLLALTVDG